MRRPPAVYCIAQQKLSSHLPDPQFALREPNGLLAAGGDLSMERLLEAYRAGIFPWYEQGQPILWWSPDPRSVLLPKSIKVSKSLRKTLRKTVYQVTFDTCFREVIQGCAASRGPRTGTWLTGEMIEAYCRLFDAGFAHSVECWQGDVLAGGLYGIALGRVFFGESMFSRANDASKVALVTLAATLQDWHFQLIDCQVHNPHLASLGAVQIPRPAFLELLSQGGANWDGPSAWGTTAA